MTGTACECGLDYVRGHPENEKLHARTHSEYELGPRITSLRRLPVLKVGSWYKFHVVDRTVSEQDRARLAYVAKVASRSTRYPSGYDGTVTDDDQRLYLLTADTHAIAMLLTALDERFWRLSWGKAADAMVLIDNHAVMRRGFKFARAWVAARYRRQGLASDLIRNVSSHLGVGVDMMGWELPFSEEGAALARRFVPDSFLGCCDVHTLLESTARDRK